MFKVTEAAKTVDDAVVSKMSPAEKLYHPALTMSQRFGEGVTGRRLWDAALQAYHVMTIQKQDWFDENGEPTLVSDPLNLREHEAVEQRYMAGLCQHSLMQDCRGPPLARLSAGGTRPLRLIGFATLARAFYRFHALKPENPMLQYALEIGLQNITVISDRTPDVVVAWFRDAHNSWNAGVATTIVQKIGQVEAVEAEWKVHCSAQGITSRNCPGGYESHYWRWLQKAHPKKFRTYNEFENIKVLFHKLNSKKWFDCFSQFMGKHCDYLNDGFDQEVLAANLRTWITLLMSSKIDDTLMEVFFLEGLRCMPE